MPMIYATDPQRTAALAEGSTTYDGRPCPRCDAVKRYTSSGCCVRCAKLRATARQRGERPHRRVSVPTADAARRQAARRHDYAPPPPESECPPAPNDNRCECCEKVPNHALHLDHDHITGHFRGWICFTCNRGIAALGDDLRGVLRAGNYLKRSATR